MLSSTQDYLKWIDEKKKIGMSWLVNSIETSRRVDNNIPEMALARDIAARNSLGCGLVRNPCEKNDVRMTISEAKRQFMKQLGERRDNNKRISLENVEIKGIMTDISGFMIIDRCRKCGKETKAKRICRCGGETTARLSVSVGISDNTGTMPVVCEDRIAEIILAAHPAQIAARISNIQRGYLFTFKHHLIGDNGDNENGYQVRASAGHVSHLRNLVNPIYAKAMMGQPVSAAGNLFQNKNGRINMKLFWFETSPYEEETANLLKRAEIRTGAKNPVVKKRLECLKKL